MRDVRQQPNELDCVSHGMWPLTFGGRYTTVIDEGLFEHLWNLRRFNVKQALAPFLKSIGVGSAQYGETRVSASGTASRRKSRLITEIIQ